MALEAPMAAGAGNPVTGGRGNIRAADADRDRVAEFLSTAYSEGRLSKEEYDARLEATFSARTYAELDHVVADLPRPAAMTRRAAGPVMAPPVGKVNAYAMASIACGLGQFVVGPLATIPAIVLGHMARAQIRRTGQQGAALALAGLILGWGAVILGILIVIAIALVSTAGMQGPMQTP